MLSTERFLWPESIATVDRLAAERLLKPYCDATLEEAIFLAFLIHASRTGYPCIKISASQITPLPNENLIPSILEGAKRVPSNLILRLEEQYYLPHQFSLQKTCFEEWERLTKAHSLFPLTAPPEIEGLTEEQAQAVKIGCQSLVFILTGGPGTGKTHTAGRLLKALQKDSKQIAIAAPTGKAALTLEKSLENSFGCNLKAKTLHALLGVKADGSFPERLTALPYDIILIDEASMINTEMMTRLLSSIKTGAQLFLMGDPHQLPPVEGTPIFPLLVEKHTAKVKLTKCLRAETKELVEFAESIRQGATLTSNSSVQFLADSLETVLAQHLNFFPQKILSENELLSAFQKFRILTPLKVGPSGSIAVNQWIRKRLYKEGINAVPIMITANDYRLELFNGEVGILLTGFNSPEKEYVYFASGKKLPALLLPSYELAYAMTVHKSQGSEFDQVLLLLPNVPASKSIPLLYTAVTRARKKILFWQET